MTLLRLGGTLEREFPREPTALKRLREWFERGTREPRSSPPLDVERLRRRYGPETAYAPKTVMGTFTAPNDGTTTAFRHECARKIRLWLDEMARQGLDWTGQTITLRNGMTHPRSPFNEPIAGAREYIVATAFVERHPTITRLQIDPALLETTHAAGTGET